MIKYYRPEDQVFQLLAEGNTNAMIRYARQKGYEYHTHTDSENVEQVRVIAPGFVLDSKNGETATLYIRPTEGDYWLLYDPISDQLWSTDDSVEWHLRPFDKRIAPVAKISLATARPNKQCMTWACH